MWEKIVLIIVGIDRATKTIQLYCAKKKRAFTFTARARLTYERTYAHINIQEIALKLEKYCPHICCVVLLIAFHTGEFKFYDFFYEFPIHVPRVIITECRTV